MNQRRNLVTMSQRKTMMNMDPQRLHLNHHIKNLRRVMMNMDLLKHLPNHLINKKRINMGPHKHQYMRNPRSKLQNLTALQKSLHTDQNLSTNQNPNISQGQNPNTNPNISQGQN